MSRAETQRPRWCCVFGTRSSSSFVNRWVPDFYLVTPITGSPIRPSWAATDDQTFLISLSHHYPLLTSDRRTLIGSECIVSKRWHRTTDNAESDTRCVSVQLIYRKSTRLSKGLGTRKSRAKMIATDSDVAEVLTKYVQTLSAGCTCENSLLRCCVLFGIAKAWPAPGRRDNDRGHSFVNKEAQEIMRGHRDGLSRIGRRVNKDIFYSKASVVRLTESLRSAIENSPGG